MRRWAKTSKIKLNMATSGTILSRQLYETSEEGQHERVPSWEGKQRWFRLTNQKPYSTITCSRFHYLHSPTKIFSCFLSLPTSLYCFCLCRANSSSLRWPLVFYAQFVWKRACRYINRIKNIVSRISRFIICRRFGSFLIFQYKCFLDNYFEKLYFWLQFMYLYKLIIYMNSLLNSDFDCNYQVLQI